jgi:pyruvate dehydrogenase E2 component (dihydrolipoamide acetyltransferase)
MAHEITVPRLGWSMEEGVFVRWLKDDGQFVRPGDPLFELESDKATQEVESIESGILRVPAGAPKPGSVVKVGALLGYLVAEGETIPEVRRQDEAALGPVPQSPGEPSAQHPLPTPADARDKPLPARSLPRGRLPAAPPSVRRLARQLGVDVDTLILGGARIGAGGLKPQASTSGAVPDGRRPLASPRARRVARQLNIDLTAVTGTGRGGRIRERDVRAVHAARESPPTEAAAAPARTVVATSARRRTIAARMVESHRQTAPVTLTMRADATNLVNLREQFKASAQPVVPSYTDIVIKLVAAALSRHPLIAARWQDDHVILADRIDVALAVDTEAGLLAPVIRDVPALSLPELARESAELVERARAGKLSAEQMQGGVFTVTSLGALGIDAFTPIIQLPQVAILGIGAIRREAVVRQDALVARDQVTLSLTFDHRVVDGAPAARFLREVRLAIENPSACLLGRPNV